MPDITMCKGDNCELKNECYRHEAEPSDFRQSWFMKPPFESIFECNYFWQLEPEIQE